LKQQFVKRVKHDKWMDHIIFGLSELFQGATFGDTDDILEACGITTISS
jgi:hypothetical protein